MQGTRCVGSVDLSRDYGHRSWPNQDRCGVQPRGTLKSPGEAQVIVLICDTLLSTNASAVRKVCGRKRHKPADSE